MLIGLKQIIRPESLCSIRALLQIAVSDIDIEDADMMILRGF